MLTDRETMERIAEETDTILLAFSRGKESIASWLRLRESGLFKRIVPYYMWIVPNLPFIDESLAYYERAIVRASNLAIRCALWRTHPNTERRL